MPGFQKKEMIDLLQPIQKTAKIYSQILIPIVYFQISMENPTLSVSTQNNISVGRHLHTVVKSKQHDVKKQQSTLQKSPSSSVTNKKLPKRPRSVQGKPPHIRLSSPRGAGGGNNLFSNNVGEALQQQFDAHVLSSNRVEHGHQGNGDVRPRQGDDQNNEIFMNHKLHQDQWVAKEREYQEKIIELYAFIHYKNLTNSFNSYIQSNEFATQRSSLAPVMITEVDQPFLAKRISSNLFKNNSQITASQKDQSNYFNQSSFLEEIQKQMFGSIILSTNGAYPTGDQKVSRETPRDHAVNEFIAPETINKNVKKKSINPDNFTKNRSTLELDYDALKQSKQRASKPENSTADPKYQTATNLKTGTKLSLRKRFSLYNYSSGKNANSSSCHGQNDIENSTVSQRNKLMSLSPRNVFKQFTRNNQQVAASNTSPIDKPTAENKAIKEHKSMFNSKQRNKSKSTYQQPNLEKQTNQAGNDDDPQVSSSQIQQNRFSDDHIVYINCSPEKNTSKRKEQEIPLVSPQFKSTPFDFKTSLNTERSVNSASRDKFAMNQSLNNAAYANENNESFQVDSKKKEPNTSSIIMVKQKSPLKTEREIQSQPVLQKKKSQSSYKEFFKQKCLQPYLRKKANETFAGMNDKQSEGKNYSVSQTTDGPNSLIPSPMKQLQLQIPGKNSKAQAQSSVNKSRRINSTQPVIDYNQNKQSLGPRSKLQLNNEYYENAARLNQTKQKVPKTTQLISDDFEEDNERTAQEYQLQKGANNSEFNLYRSDSIGHFPKMNPSPSRMSKLTRRKSEQIAMSGRPGPCRQPSKPIDRPLSRQNEAIDNPKSLYLVAQPSSLESDTIIVRDARTSFKDHASPDPVIADESEMLSNLYNKSEQIKDTSKSNDLKLSNSDTMMQGQKPQIYPPEFVRRSDLSSVVLDESEYIAVNDRNHEIKQFFENTNINSNMINHGPQQIIKPLLSHRERYQQSVSEIEQRKINVQRCQSQAFELHVRRLNNIHDGDENVRESIIEQNESPRNKRVNQMQNSTNRFSNELQTEGLLLNDQILSQSESFITLSSQPEFQQLPAGKFNQEKRSLQQMVSQTKLKLSHQPQSHSGIFGPVAKFPEAPLQIPQNKQLSNQSTNQFSSPQLKTDQLFYLKKQYAQKKDCLEEADTSNQINAKNSNQYTQRQGLSGDALMVLNNTHEYEQSIIKKQPIASHNTNSSNNHILQMELEASSEVESNKSVDNQLNSGNIAADLLQPTQVIDFDIYQGKNATDQLATDNRLVRNNSTEVGNFGSNRKSQKYLGNQLNENIDANDLQSCGRVNNKQESQGEDTDKLNLNQLPEFKKQLTGAVSQKHIGSNNLLNLRQTGSHSILVEQRSHNDPGVFSQNNLNLQQASLQEVSTDENFFMERALEMQSNGTMPRRGRITLKERKNAAKLYCSHLQSATDLRAQEEITFKAQSAFQEGKSVNTNQNTDAVQNSILHLQNSIVGHQYLQKQSKLSSDLADYSLNDFQLKASVQNRHSHVYKYLKQQQNDNASIVIGSKKEYGQSDEFINIDSVNQMTDPSVLIEQTSFDVVNPAGHPVIQSVKNDYKAAKILQNKQKLKEYANEEEDTVYKITELSSGLHNSGVTIIQSQNNYDSYVKQQVKTPQEYLLTEIQSVTEGPQSIAMDSSVFNQTGTLDNLKSAHHKVSTSRPSGVQAMSPQGQSDFNSRNSPQNQYADSSNLGKLTQYANHGRQASQWYPKTQMANDSELEQLEQSTKQKQQLVDGKKYATCGGIVDIENEEQPIDMLDHLQIARATKGTIFQSSIKFKENIDVDEDQARQALEDSFINLSTSKKLFKHQNSNQLNQTSGIEDLAHFENTVKIYKNPKSALLQKRKQMVKNYSTQISQQNHKDDQQLQFTDDEDHMAFMDQAENARVDTIQSPSPIVRDVYPRDSIRSQNRSSIGEDDSFFSPNRVQSIHGKFLKSDRNPKNNRHSIYRNEIINDGRAYPSVQKQIQMFIEQEILLMKSHSNILQKLSNIHNKKIKPNSRLFEQFYLVGPALTGVPLFRNDKVDISGDETMFSNLEFLHELRSPTFHYQFPEVAALKQVRIRSQSIVDFVFPNGVKCIPINNSNLSDALDKTLNQIPSNRSSAFVFTLDARLESTLQIPADEIIPGHLNCLCVKLNTIVRITNGTGTNQKDAHYFMTEQALCLLSCNQYFDAQFEVLDKFLEYIRIVQKIKSLRMSNHFTQVNQNPVEQLNVFQNTNILKHELEPYLKHIYDQIDLNGQSHAGPLQKVIQVQMKFSDEFEQDEHQVIKYSFPDNQFELGLVSLKWHIPTILDVIDQTEDIFKLMTAVLLEKSIIVVSDDQSKISSVILGIIEMIQPFQWQFIQIPVLPEALLDTLDVPVPIIAGITETSFQHLIEDYNLSETFIDSMTWVFLDPVTQNSNKCIHQMAKWRVASRNIKWSVYEGNITQDEQDWFRNYQDMRQLEETHRKFRMSGVSHSIESYKSIINREQQDETTHCLELTEKQVHCVNQFVTQFHTLFFKQILQFTCKVPDLIPSTAAKNMKPFELHTEFKNKLMSQLSNNNNKVEEQAPSFQINQADFKLSMRNRSNFNDLKFDASNSNFRQPPKTMRNNYNSSIISMGSSIQEQPSMLQKSEIIAKLRIDPSCSLGFLRTFKETQTFLEYCDNVHRACQNHQV